MTVCALQCDRCVGKETWTCIDCLNMTNETYMQLMKEADKPKSKVRWFCDNCDKMVMSPGNGQQEKLDAAIKLLEQMLERTQVIEQRLQGIEQRIADKADVTVVNQLELRVEKLELEINLRSSVVPEKAVSADHDIEVNLNELKERKKRRNNLIVFNIPECNSTDCNERKGVRCERSRLYIELGNLVSTPRLMIQLDWDRKVIIVCGPGH